jgi:STE24 endopeptidase
MQIVLIIIFAAVLSLPGRSLFHPIAMAATGAEATLIIAAALTILIPFGVGIASWLCVRRLRQPGGFAYASLLFGRVHLGMRIALLGQFALLVFETGWPRLVRSGWGLDRYPLAAEMVLVGPVLLATMLCWLAMYPADRALRISAGGGGAGPASQPVWTVGQYLDFQVRYQMLTVLVPMSLFIVTSDLMRMYGRELIRRMGAVWVPEVILAVVAGTIFVLSPVMLRYLWRTEELKDSPLRSRLEETCRLMGLRYRRILVWKSHGAMVNAAVMGLLPQVRYILLSDGLLEHLSTDQVESVFGHEAGHVKERHITYYLLFAIGSMIGLSLAGDWMEYGLGVSPDTVEMVVLGMIGLTWFVIFGWISRRFERQADLHGVRCVSDLATNCTLPCWLHNITPAEPKQERLCTTAAGVFGSALEAVAALNGINKRARSWRHSSIASRQEFIHQAAYYPDALRRFERAIRWIKASLLAIALGLALVAGWFYWPVVFPQGPQPRKERDGRHRSGPKYVVEGRTPSVSRPCLDALSPGWDAGAGLG